MAQSRFAYDVYEDRCPTRLVLERLADKWALLILDSLKDGPVRFNALRRDIKRISKPGRRVYSAVRELPTVANGLGVSILSTPKGVMSDSRAREENVGGEVLCSVF